MPYLPGMIVTCRGRDWVVMDGSTQTDLILRPVDGDEDDVTWVFVPLEFTPVSPE